MTEKVKFSSLHGHNIVLSNSSSTATWYSKQVSGWASSSSPLEPGQSVVVEIDGSGHCLLGFFRQEPDSKNRTKQTIKQINEIRIHKKKCVIHVTLNDRGTEVSSQFMGKTFTKAVNQNTKLWLTIFVKFGCVSARLLLNGSPEHHISFSKHHGENISLGENNCSISTIHLNPSSTCYVKEKIQVGEELLFQCEPLLEGGREPSRFHVKFEVYERNPESLKKDFKYLFDYGPVSAGEPQTTTLEIFEKDDCKGVISVTLINDKAVGYRSASSKYNEQSLRNGSDGGVWVILELYRTTVTVIKRKELPQRNNANVVDSAVREPSNACSENSIDPFVSHQERTELKRQASDYYEVTEVNTVEDNTTDRRVAVLESKCALLNKKADELHKKVDELTKKVQRGGTCNNSFTLSSVKSVMSKKISGVSRIRSSGDRQINIRNNYTLLIKDIDCVPLSDKLFEKEIITITEYQEITTESSTDAGNRKLLLTINKKRVMKSTMDQILDETEQSHLKDLF